MSITGKYSELWEQLRVYGHASILADPVAHARIKKAVSKYKYMDLAFKEKHMRQGIVPYITFKVDAADPRKLSFELNFRGRGVLA